MKKFWSWMATMVTQTLWMCLMSLNCTPKKWLKWEFPGSLAGWEICVVAVLAWPLPKHHSFLPRTSACHRCCQKKKQKKTKKNKKKKTAGVPTMAQWIKTLTAVAQVTTMAPVQCPQSPPPQSTVDPALQKLLRRSAVELLWFKFNLWSRNFHMPRV